MAEGLADVLLRDGVVDLEGVQQARSYAEQHGVPFSKAVTGAGLATEQQIVRAVASHLGYAFADCSPGAVDPEAAALLPAPVARELCALPVAYTDEGGLLVALAEPNPAPLERVAIETGLPVAGALAVREQLVRAIDGLAGTAAPASGSNGEAPHSPAAAPPAEVGGHGPLLEYEQEAALDLHDCLEAMMASGASDLHLTVGLPPMVRVHGDLEPLKQFEELTPNEIRKVLYSILNQKQREEFENTLELDLSYALPGVARFRVNIFQQRDSLGAVMRVIPMEILELDKLGVPAQVANFAHLARGFVLVTGPTGSGKSTTLASIIDAINREQPRHIMTVEDPIEFLHRHRRSVVNQRELGSDTHSFAAALKHVLRQDPDVILVGELRDLETIQVALTAAETGHLVFGTLHTQDAPQTVDRLIDVFPPHQQEQIRVQLGGALQGVLCQQLLKTTDGQGRVAATELMIATPAIRNLIREGKTHQMYSSIQAGKSHGMITMDQSLANLVTAGKVTYDAALEKCNNVADFNRLCGRA